MCFPRGIFGRNDLSPPGPRKKKKVRFLIRPNPPGQVYTTWARDPSTFPGFFVPQIRNRRSNWKMSPRPLKRKSSVIKKNLLWKKKKKKYREGGRKLITPTRNGSTSAKLQHPELSDFFKSIFVRVKSLTRFHWNYSNFLRFLKKKNLTLFHPLLQDDGTFSCTSSSLFRLLGSTTQKMGEAIWSRREEGWYLTRALKKKKKLQEPSK